MESSDFGSRSFTCRLFAGCSGYALLSGYRLAYNYRLQCFRCNTVSDTEEGILPKTAATQKTRSKTVASATNGSKASAAETKRDLKAVVDLMKAEYDKRHSSQIESIKRTDRKLLREMLYLMVLGRRFRTVALRLAALRDRAFSWHSYRAPEGCYQTVLRYRCGASYELRRHRREILTDTRTCTPD